MRWFADCFKEFRQHVASDYGLPMADPHVAAVMIHRAMMLPKFLRWWRKTYMTDQYGGEV